jgi:membrane-associated progesterone receptor component
MCKSLAVCPHRALPPTVLVADIVPFNGADGRRIYIAIDGVVFDMSSHESGAAFYGPGGGYNIFAGKDATIGLASMQLDPTQWKRTRVEELSASEQDVVIDWVARFRAKYAVVGSLLDGSRPSTLLQLKERNVL